ncbi:MAG: right-handed parallel beta-helix repeat-containing protein [Planctomycetota bacterium]|nr:right-handed parallel beta-helix repeat-containing protein [Planctomycetota bacterium]
MSKIRTVEMLGLVCLLSFSYAEIQAAPTKGVISVRKDGKGDFTRIVPALMLSEPGEIIEIRDSAVYRESLNLAAFPKRTIRAAEGQNPTLIGMIDMGDYVVIEGLKITYPSKVRGGESTIKSNGKKGWVVRNCEICNIPHNSQAFYMVNGTREAKIISNRIHGGRGGAAYITVNYENGNNLFANNIIYNIGGISISSSSPNNRIVSNTFYKSGITCTSGSTAIENNIVVSGEIKSTGPVRYNCLWKSECKGSSEEANITQDPLLTDPEKEDFHLKSKAGRWNPNAKKWVKDKVHSLCINSGDPKPECSNEPAPNGKRINMGAYGNTKEASKSTE